MNFGSLRTRSLSRCHRCLAVLAALLLAASATAAEAQGAPAPELVVAVTHRPPWTIVREDGAIVGPEVELLRAMEKRLGVKFRFQAFPWRRCIEMLRQGRVDMITRFSRTREREAFALYITPAYSKEDLVFFVKKGSELDLRQYSDLYGPRVGVMRGNAYTPEFDADQRISKTVVERKGQLFRMLVAGRIDVAAGFDRPARHGLATQGLSDAVSVCALRLPREDADHFALSRKSPHLRLAPEFGRTVAQMLASGEIARIIESAAVPIKKPGAGKQGRGKR